MQHHGHVVRVIASLGDVSEYLSLEASLPLLGDDNHAAVPSGVARSIRACSRGLFIASHRSLRRCTFSQKSGLLPRIFCY